jgi:hypothetical protein
MGTNTCGSLKLPASYNNLVAIRPTKGLTSVDGVAPLSNTQDATGFDYETGAEPSERTLGRPYLIY